MTSGSNNFNDFPEILPTREITDQNRIEKTYLFLVLGLFVECAQCCSINSTRVNAALAVTNAPLLAEPGGGKDCKASFHVKTDFWKSSELTTAETASG